MPISLPFTLPEGFSEAEFRALAPTDMWERDSQQAAILALRRSGTFDEAAYLEANPDVRENGMGAIEHYVMHGCQEKRRYFIANTGIYNAIVFICDNNFVEATCVAIASLIKSKKKNVKYEIFIITNKISQDNMNKFNLIDINNCKLTIIKAISEYEDIVAYKNLVNSTALYKFNIPNILYKYKNALYLDSDVLVLQDISELFSYNIHKSYGLVVEDIVGREKHQENIRIKHKRYFNSGVMLLNLERMRNENSYAKMVSMKRNNTAIKYMDQDVFNIFFNEDVIYISPYYNYMTTNNSLPDDILSKYFDGNICQTKIKIIHYTYLKPWKHKGILFEKLWHQAYDSIFKVPPRIDNHIDISTQSENITKSDVEHIIRSTISSLRTEIELFMDFLATPVRNNSVLIIEAADCHGEVLPGFVLAFLNLGYHIDIILTNNNFEMNPLSRIENKEINIFRNHKYRICDYINSKKLTHYEYICFSSRTLYYKINNNAHPSIFEYFPEMPKPKKKVISLEHHLEYISDKEKETMILANPTNNTNLQHMVVNFCEFGKIEITHKNKEMTKFICIGNIEKERKNYALLLDGAAQLLEKNVKFSITIIARRGDIYIPEHIKPFIEKKNKSTI